MSVELIPLLQQSDFDKLGVVHVGEKVMLLSCLRRRKVSIHSNDLQYHVPISCIFQKMHVWVQN